MTQLSKPLTKDVIVTFLKEQKQFLTKKFGISPVALFGSYARGDFTQDSDIDLLIESQDTSFRSWMALKDFLQETFGKKVDLVEKKSLRTFIRRMIEEDLVYV